MSSLKQRKETNCLNCNAEVYGRYCHICGQENTEPNESFWHLTTHFVADLFHYDGKFLRTLKYLLFKPGYLAKEHIKGKRVDYLHPIRLYIFISAAFFLIMYLFVNKHEENHRRKLSDVEIAEMKMTYFQRQLSYLKSKSINYKNSEIEPTNKIPEDNDTIIFDTDENRITPEKAKKIDLAIPLLEKDSSKLDSVFYSLNLTPMFVNAGEYLNYQKRIPKNYRDNFINKKLETYNIQKREQSKERGVSEMRLLGEDILHALPKILFICMPFVSFFLMLIYIRRRKKYNYVAHLLFTIYLICAYYIFTFFLMLEVRLVDAQIHNRIHFLFRIAFFLLLLFYTYKSFRVFYEQGRFKTVLKILLLIIPVLFACLIGFILGIFAIAVAS